MASSCRFDPVNQTHINWRQLNDNDKRLVRPDSMKRSLQCILQTILRLQSQVYVDQRLEPFNKLTSIRQMQTNQDDPLQLQSQPATVAKRPKRPRNTNAIPEPKIY